jgi:hypothetical protein
MLLLPSLLVLMPHHDTAIIFITCPDVTTIFIACPDAAS